MSVSMRSVGSVRRAAFAGLLLAVLASAPASAASMWGQLLGPSQLGAVSVGHPLTYSHTFDVPGATVMGATLFVFTADQPGCVSHSAGSCNLVDAFLTPETADIDVAGADFASGSATNHLFVGAVTQALIDSGNVLDVVVKATSGNFHVWTSYLLVAYQPAGGTGSGTAAPAPEPGAAALFGIGVLAVARASQRRPAAR